MSFEEIGKSVAKAQIKKPSLFLFGILLVIALTVPGSLLLLDNIEPSLEKVLPQDVQEVKTMNDMRSLFGADMMYLVFNIDGPVTDVRNPDVVKYLDMVSDKLRTVDYIKEVMSISDVIKEYNYGIISDSKRVIEDIVSISQDAQMFVNDDFSMVMIQIRSDTGANSKIIKEVVDNIDHLMLTLENSNPGLTYSITGFNAIDKATFEVIIQDFAYITIFSFAFIFIVLMFYFGGNIRKVISSLSVIMIAVLITLGITGYIGITVTVVTMVAAAMIMALGISYGINITYEYYLLREKYNKNNSLIHLNTDLIRALSGSSLTTSAGFLALLFGIIPAMKNLGIVLAIGITVTLFVSILVLPVIVYKLDGGKK